MVPVILCMIWLIFMCFCGIKRLPGFLSEAVHTFGADNISREVPRTIFLLVRSLLNFNVSIAQHDDVT